MADTFDIYDITILGGVRSTCKIWGQNSQAESNMHALFICFQNTLQRGLS